jgi:hypothetical protein
MNIQAIVSSWGFKKRLGRILIMFLVISDGRSGPLGENIGLSCRRGLAGDADPNWLEEVSSVVWGDGG